MKGTVKKLNIDGYECSLYLPPEYETNMMNYPVLYVNGGDKIPEIIGGLESHFGSDCQAFLLLSIQPSSWNNDFSPWSAAPLMEKDEPFGGGAREYLEFLTERAKTYIDRHYCTKPDPEDTALVGYSLGGLAALFSLYTCKTFGKIGCLSGSLWFEGWTEFAETNILLNTDAKVYLSLGRGEEHSRNQRMAKVGDCTVRTAEILGRKLNSEKDIIFEWNNGGHFTEIPQRYQKAILRLMQNEKRGSVD